eukprot:TRINITY_DN1621_c0_g1_i2.p1 TRINITY_DN1621_c0_g1~~TRINITY_DN1621_c0_g1_i2.p1  ORF type:complete len:116 (-),score=8.36 TRINITY_DN1621_c0_g1_i2:445-792(-)
MWGYLMWGYLMWGYLMWGYLIACNVRVVLFAVSLCEPSLRVTVFFTCGRLLRHVVYVGHGVLVASMASMAAANTCIHIYPSLYQSLYQQEVFRSTSNSSTTSIAYLHIYRLFAHF